jgi:hypothetical protein
MRHLAKEDIASTLRRGKSVEQFLGRNPEDETGAQVRWVELRPAKNFIEAWVYDVDDVGDENQSDIYDFPFLDPDGPVAPAASFSDALAAAAYASEHWAAHPDRWVNQGVIADEYLDYIRSGRPAKWPSAA